MKLAKAVSPCLSTNVSFFSSRYISTSCLVCGKGVSSAIWINRHVKDHYVRKSRYENFRARSAYKLLEINQRFNFLRPGITAVDCGAAPGAWTEVMVRECYPDGILKENGTLIVAVDIGGIAPIEGAHTLPFTDFTSTLNQAKIISLLRDRQVDVLCSDMCPNVSGCHELDHPASTKLVISALNFGVRTLKPKSGVFLTKILNGPKSDDLKKLLDKFFDETHSLKPPSSREDSTEMYLLGLKFKGIKQPG